MLNSFLDKLTSLLSKSYVISAGFPVLIFTFVNASLLYAHHAGFRAFINTEAPSSSFSALTSKVLMFVLILVILAYILSTLQPKLRELLEGHRWYGWMGDPFRAIQKEKYDRLTKGLEDAKDAAAKSDEARQWRKDLAKARAEGDATNQCPSPQLTTNAELAAIRGQRLRGEALDLTNLQTVKVDLESVLKKNSASVPDGAKLDQVSREFDDLLQYAVNRSQDEVTRLFTQRAASFGDDDYFLPTAAGNIARTMATYAYSRYRFNLDLLWTRLQKVMQSDSLFYPVVQDAKAQLDFAVSTFWLLIISAIIWFFIFALSGTSVTLFLLAALALPIAAVIAYGFAVVSYHSFADVVRASVDLYRLDLLKTLHLPRPRSADAERALWEDVSRALAYGELIDLRYEHPL